MSRRAGVPICSLHQFRHTCASDLLQAGVHRGTSATDSGARPASPRPCVMCTSLTPQRRAAMQAHPHQRLVSNARAAGGRMNALDPLIEGYLSYLDKVGRKTPAHHRGCALHAAPGDGGPGADPPRCGSMAPGALRIICVGWRVERQQGRTDSCLAKYLSHLRGLLDYAWRSGRSERNVLDGFSLQHTISSHRAQAPDAGGGRAARVRHRWRRAHRSA